MIRSSSNVSEKKLLQRERSDVGGGGAGTGTMWEGGRQSGRQSGRQTMRGAQGGKRKAYERSTSSLVALANKNNADGNGTGGVEVEFKQKEKKLQPANKYRFHCDGVISREYKKLRSRTTRTVDKEVRYRAEFSGNVEEFLYPSLRARKEQPSDTEDQHHPVDFADDEQIKERERLQNDFSLNWEVDIEDKPERLLDDGTPSAQLSDKGENTLRELLRKKYHDRFSKEKSIKAAKMAEMAKIVRKENLLNSIYGERKNDADTPDEVYYEMVCKGKAEGMKVLQKNAATTSLERAFDVKSETLARVLPSSYTDARLKEHMPGLLYYQIKKDLSEKKMNDRLIHVKAPRQLKKQSSQDGVFEEEYGDASVSQTTNTYTNTDTDPSLCDESTVDELPESPPPRPTRAPVRRTMSSIQNRATKFRAHRGITQDGINEDDDEEETEAHLRAMTHLSHSSMQEYSCNSMSRFRRAHFAEMNGSHVGDVAEDGSVTVALGATEQTVAEKKRRAQDVLLSQQLRQGIIPEQLLRKIPRMGELISLDLSHYSMGDDLGACLGRSLGVLEMLHTLGLRGNRLTHKSMVPIFENISLRALRHLDVSVNSIAGPSLKVLCKRLRSKECKISSLELVKTSIGYDDVKDIANAIMVHETSWLMELSLAQNNLNLQAMRELVRLLKYDGCALSWLDLSWNEFNSSSGECLAEALNANKSLTSLDLSSNALRDEGGQHIAACLLANKSLQEIYLSLNNIGGKTCFIFSKVLRRHPSMKRLNISDNPLTEAGARSIFRTILKGLRCFVMMQSCTFNSETGLFKHSNPSLDSPYTLDLNKPYEVSILSELINMVNDPTKQCTFRHLSYKQSERDKSMEIVSEFADGETYLRHGASPWGIPSSGLLTVHFGHQLSMPEEGMAIDELAFNTILAIVVNARSENDRKNWLFLMCMDAYFTTAQAQDLIDILDDRRLLGPGGISVVEFFRCIWSNILDTENVYDFMYHNLDDGERVSLMHLLSFEKFKFNWLNPTGHWRLDLNNRCQRAVMMQLIALNIVESKASKKAKRGDTSQKGNWCNYRNEKINGTPCAIDMEFSKSLPFRGVLEFDYVSTTRPPPDAQEISDDDFSDFIIKLDLTTRRRCDISMSAMKLLELQLAVTNYYFKASRVINIMDCFSEDDNTQARVVIVLFCRILDLHNLETVFRHVTAAATQDVFVRLGLLNCINPLKPTHNLKLNMRYMDCRILAHTFLSMSSLENGDQLKQHPRSDIDIIVLYSQLGRVIADEHSSDVYLMFTYCEIGERQSEVAWNYRKDMCSKFLVGSKPWDTKMFKIIKMYKEIVAAKALMMGPIDLQYKAFIKNKIVKRGKNTLRSAGVVSKLKGEVFSASRSRDNDSATATATPTTSMAESSSDYMNNTSANDLSSLGGVSITSGGGVSITGGGGGGGGRGGDEGSSKLLEALSLGGDGGGSISISRTSSVDPSPSNALMLGGEDSIFSNNQQQQGDSLSIIDNNQDNNQDNKNQEDNTEDSLAPR